MRRWIKASHQAFYWETLGAICLLALGILAIRTYILIP